VFYQLLDKIENSFSDPF
jgi:uncharacterized protein YaaR (DUF327 family)